MSTDIQKVADLLLAMPYRDLTEIAGFLATCCEAEDDLNASFFAESLLNWADGVVEAEE